MKKSESIKYFDKVWKQMELHLTHFLETGSQENLHNFRVQIKKLKAMIILMEYANKGSALGNVFKPVAKVFKIAGKVREAHINLSLTARYKIINEPFEAGQNQIITEGLKKMRLNANDTFKNIKDVYKQIKKRLPKIKDGFVTAFYRNHLNQLSKQLESPKFTEEMHQNRKLIKLLIYNNRLTATALYNQIKLNAEYLDKLQNAIGEWHDNLVAAQLFSTGQVINAGVVKVINRKSSAIKKTIKSLAADFIKKATLAEVGAGKPSLT